MKLFDTHFLIGRDKWLSENKPELAHKSDLSGAVAALDATGASAWRAAIFPFPSCEDGSYIPENVAVLEAARQDTRLLPVAVVNPSNDAGLDWVLSRLSAGQLRGLMIWPILSELNLEELHACTRLWSAVAKYDIPVTVHVGVGNEPSLGRAVKQNRYDPGAAIALAAALPSVRFNLSHALRLSRSALQKAAGLTNVMMDVSGLSALGRWYEAGQEVFPAKDRVFASSDAALALRALGDLPEFAGRLMFGSSWPLNLWWGFDPAAEVRLLHSAVPEETFAAMTWANPCRFYSESP